MKKSDDLLTQHMSICTDPTSRSLAFGSILARSEILMVTRADCSVNVGLQINMAHIFEQPGRQNVGHPSFTSIFLQVNLQEAAELRAKHLSCNYYNKRVALPSVAFFFVTVTCLHLNTEMRCSYSDLERHTLEGRKLCLSVTLVLQMNTRAARKHQNFWSMRLINDTTNNSVNSPPASLCRATFVFPTLHTEWLTNTHTHIHTHTYTQAHTHT
jgi:hypothetical protein